MSTSTKIFRTIKARKFAKKIYTYSIFWKYCLWQKSPFQGSKNAAFENIENNVQEEKSETKNEIKDSTFKEVDTKNSVTEHGNETISDELASKFTDLKMDFYNCQSCYSNDWFECMCAEADDESDKNSTNPYQDDLETLVSKWNGR